MNVSITVAVSLLSLSAFAGTKPPRDSFLEEALFAGGARDQVELDRLVALFHARIDPMVEVIRDSPPQIAAQLLLKHLHLSYGGTTAVLKEYQLGAFSINQALDTGKYNCLSASMLFILAARQAGLEVTGEQYYDHARVVFMDDGREFQVEPTDASGWNVSEWYVRARSSSLGNIALVVDMPMGRGNDLMMDATWAWAREPRDARWATRIAPSPPPLITAFSVP